jgi:hypothetical protein
MLRTQKINQVIINEVIYNACGYIFCNNGIMLNTQVQVHTYHIIHNETSNICFCNYEGIEGVAIDILVLYA